VAITDQATYRPHTQLFALAFLLEADIPPMFQWAPQPQSKSKQLCPPALLPASGAAAPGSQGACINPDPTDGTLSSIQRN